MRGKRAKEIKEGDFFILCNDSTDPNRMDIHQDGPYATEKKALLAIQDEVEDCVANCGEVEMGRMEDYSSEYCVAKVIKRVHPVPVVSVEVVLEPGRSSR